MTDDAFDRGPPEEPLAYWWDFFGPNAERTARHHASHLREFLEGKGHAHSEIGTASAGAGHFGAYCIAEPVAKQLVESTLRPNRVTPSSVVPR